MENYKALLRETKKDVHTWRNITYLWIGKLQIMWNINVSLNSVQSQSITSLFWNLCTNAKGQEE